MIKLSPSILSADFSNLKKELNDVETAGSQYIHMDVMDGVFVPNITFGAPVIEKLRAVSNMVFDVHLMIIEPIRYIKEFADAGADIITFHVEACKNCREVIEEIKKYGIKAAITLKPKTDIKEIIPYLNLIDMVLVMTVEPGFGGQKFIQSSLAKIESLYEFKNENNLNFDIEVDGGVNLENVRSIINAGANVIVAGSSVFGKNSSAEKAKEFLDIFKEFE